MIHVVLGTKAQYIKTAPVVRELRERGIPHRLVDTGQHAGLSKGLRTELGLPAPDVELAPGGDIVSIPQAAGWALRLLARAASRSTVRREIFADQPGICVVHGDTPSTLLATVLARRARLPVAHLEAGLRSRSLLHPFPEELIRILVMRSSSVLFAPDDTSADNLAQMGLADRTVRTPGNTVIDALRYAIGGTAPAATGPAVATMHRVENLHSPQRVTGWLDAVLRLHARHPVRVVAHGPTEAVLDRTGARLRLERAGVRVDPLLPHGDFTRALAAAPAVITDGGSVQEECALLGVPTLLWRARTERNDGIGRNVVLSGYREDLVASFVSDPDALRTPAIVLDAFPSRAIVDELVARGLAD